MRITRTTAALALALAAATAGTAHASIVGSTIGTVTSLTGVGSGGSTGIQDWFAVNRDLGNGHFGRFYCEYALEPDGSGHFESGTNALVNGTLTSSPDATGTGITCTFYGTPNGSPSFALPATSGSTNWSSGSFDGAAGRPTKICMTGSVTWANGDVASVSNLCQGGRTWVDRGEATATLGFDQGTDAIADGGTNTATGCAVRVSACATFAQEYAHTTGAMVTGGGPSGGGYQPGVNTSVNVPPPVR